MCAPCMNVSACVITTGRELMSHHVGACKSAHTRRKLRYRDSFQRLLMLGHHNLIIAKVGR